MAGFLFQTGAVMLCPHGGSASFVQPDSRVMVEGQSIATVSARFIIAGCRLSGDARCETAYFVTAANRVTANSQPVLLSCSQAICQPSGTALTIVETQTRVSAA